MKVIKSLLLVFLILPVLSLNSFATPISIVNNSFEMDTPTIEYAYGDFGTVISGWEVQGPTGTWMPSSDMFYSGIPDGDSVAWLNNAGTSISQELNWSVNAGNTLILEVDVISLVICF